MNPDFTEKNKQTDIRTRYLLLPVVTISAIFFMLILQRAWLCDDAYITFRTVDNLANGYKLTWNVIERVQAYTHPLWMFFLSFFYLFNRDIYVTALALSLTVSTAGVVLLGFKMARTRLQAFFAIWVLCLSNAYIDYSTSGLENPLTHLLLVVFFIQFFYSKPSLKKIFFLSLTASLAGVNRLDSMLLYFPAFLAALWEMRSIKGVFAGISGQFPLILWELFSLFYYGFPFPNTFYAKLNTGISSAELFNQGIYYALNSLQGDPITLLTIFAGVALAFFSGKLKPITVACGILLYLFYILKIGGDFMSGRFFTAPLLGAAIIFAYTLPERIKPSASAILIGLALLTGMLADLPTFLLRPNDDRPITDEHGITDERLWYFSDFGLFSPQRQPDLAQTAGKNGAKARVEAGQDLYIIAVDNTGVFGYYAGPYVYVIDQLALSEPLLARLPSIRSADWRIGHYSRLLPDGYISTLYGLGELDDENLALYYDKLHTIVSGRLTDPERLIEIWKMNLGQYDSLIDYDRYRYPEMVASSLDELDQLPCHQQASSDSRLYFTDSGIDIDLQATRIEKQITVCLDSDDDYRIEFRQNGQTSAQLDLHGSSANSEMKWSTLDVPPAISKKGYSHIRIFPLRGNDDYSIGGLRLPADAR